MDISITFEQGPISAEIEATEDDDVMAVLNDFAAFIEQNPRLAQPSESQHRETAGSAKGTTHDSEAEEVGDGTGQNEANEEYDNQMLKPLLENIDVAEEDFIRLVEVHEDVTPRLLQSGKLPADSATERIYNAAAVLLTVHQTCYEEEWMKSSDLSDALVDSGLSDRTDYIYNKETWNSHFDKDGEGRGTKLRMTRLGMDMGEELIEEMAHKAAEENEEQEST